MKVKKIRILQINSVCGFGSTGRNVVELSDFFINRGHECYIAYSHSTSADLRSYKYGLWLEKKIYALLTRLTGQQGLFGYYGTKDLISHINHIRPDLIHLNNLHGNHIHLPTLFSFLKQSGIPVAWTLHDCWAFTAGCTHYTSYGCSKWKMQGCSQFCPDFKSWLPNFGEDRVEKMYKIKKSLFKSLDKLHIITVSNWLKEEVEQSFLNSHPITTIYNWIDTKKFRPTTGLKRSMYGIPESKEIVLCVSAFWKKNSVRTKNLFDLAANISSTQILVMVGKWSGRDPLPPNIVHIQYVHNIDELVKIYSAALVYVHLSLEDTFGKVVAEAMACGTPAIVFNSTALPELIDKQCGFVVEANDIDAIVNSIAIIHENGKQSFSQYCVERVLSNFNADKLMLEYEDIYHNLLK